MNKQDTRVGRIGSRDHGSASASPHHVLPTFPQRNHLPAVVVMPLLDRQPVLDHQLPQPGQEGLQRRPALPQRWTEQSDALLVGSLEVGGLALGVEEGLLHLEREFLALLLPPVLADEFPEGEGGQHAEGVEPDGQGTGLEDEGLREYLLCDDPEALVDQAVRHLLADLLALPVPHDLRAPLLLQLVPHCPEQGAQVRQPHYLLQQLLVQRVQLQRPVVLLYDVLARLLVPAGGGREGAGGAVFEPGSDLLGVGDEVVALGLEVEGEVGAAGVLPVLGRGLQASVGVLAPEGVGGGQDREGDVVGPVLPHEVSQRLLDGSHHCLLLLLTVHTQYYNPARLSYHRHSARTSTSPWTLPQTERGSLVVALRAWLFQLSQPQEVCSFPQRLTYLPLFRTRTVKSAPLSECSSKTMLEAKGVPPSQFKALELPFRYSSSMQAAEAIPRPFWAATRSASWTLMVSHLFGEPGLLTLLSKLESTWLSWQVLRALERSKLRVKWLCQLQRCSMLARSAAEKAAGRGRPRQRSARMVSYRAASRVKFIEPGSGTAKVLPICFRKGAQVSTISLQSVSCARMFFSISRASLGQTSIRAELQLTVWISCPSGRAKTSSATSSRYEQGGQRYCFSAGSSFWPLPRGYIPQRFAKALWIVRLAPMLSSWYSPFTKPLLSRGTSSMYSFRKALPSDSCCLRPTPVISPHLPLVQAPSQRSLRWQRAPGEMRATAWYSLASELAARRSSSQRPWVMEGMMMCANLIKILGWDVGGVGDGLHQPELLVVSTPLATQLRSKPNKNPWKELSFNTDLEEINQMLNPRERAQLPPPTSLDLEMTRTFVMSLLAKYEDEAQVGRKWDGFISSLSSRPDFERFVKSLKEIAPEEKAEEVRANPESNGHDAPKPERTERTRLLTRVYSLKRLEPENAPKLVQSPESKVRESVRKDLLELKDLLTAGEKFIRNA